MREESRKIFEIIMSENFSKLITDMKLQIQETTWISMNNHQDKKNLHLGISLIFQKTKDRENLERSKRRKKNTSHTEEKYNGLLIRQHACMHAHWNKIQTTT